MPGAKQPPSDPWTTRWSRILAHPGCPPEVASAWKAMEQALMGATGAFGVAEQELLDQLRLERDAVDAVASEVRKSAGRAAASPGTCFDSADGTDPAVDEPVSGPDEDLPAREQHRAIARPGRGSGSRRGVPLPAVCEPKRHEELSTHRARELDQRIVAAVSRAAPMPGDQPDHVKGFMDACHAVLALLDEPDVCVLGPPKAPLAVRRSDNPEAWGQDARERHHVHRVDLERALAVVDGSGTGDPHQHLTNLVLGDRLLRRILLVTEDDVLLLPGEDTAWAKVLWGSHQAVRAAGKRLASTVVVETWLPDPGMAYATAKSHEIGLGDTWGLRPPHHSSVVLWPTGIGVRTCRDCGSGRCNGVHDWRVDQRAWIMHT
jgi:hypothetical protein